MAKRTSDARSLAEAKLASSCLTLAQAKQLGIEVLGSGSLPKLDKRWPDVPALLFRYHDVSGKPSKTMYRVRVLETPKGKFGEVMDVRYLQPAETPPAVYLPTCIDWSYIFSTASEPIVITEGELKAACCSLIPEDLKVPPAIGLGGVSSWRSAKQGWRLLPELEKVVWDQREVTIVFDSDASSNPHVALATGMLVKELTGRGAKVRVAQLPSLPDGGKCGLDDLVLASGPEALKAAIDAAPFDALAQQLWGFNARFAYVLSPGVVHDQETQNGYRPSDFKASAFANVWAVQRTLDADGNARLKETQVAKAWVEWPLRRTFNAFTYDPGEGLEVQGALNTWPGWGVAPEAGPVKLWHELLDHMFRGAEPEARRWFEAWCLYPLRYPGAKLTSAAGVWSLGQGLGKSVIGKLLGRIYGRSYVEVSQRELESAFNGWQVHKQLVMFDDVSAYDSRAKADVLKKMITEEQVHVNIKGVPTYDLPDRCNFYLTSNKPNAFYLEEGDRRFFVHEVTSPKLKPEFWAKFYAWMGGTPEHKALGPGPAALFAYALEKFSFDGFAPHEPPPVTAAKRAMVDAVRSEVEGWVADLEKDPAAKLDVGTTKVTRDLWTARELLERFEAERKGPGVTAAGLALRLRERFPMADGGAILRPNGANERFYVLRNVDRWLKASKTELEAHVASERKRERGGGKF